MARLGRNGFLAIAVVFHLIYIYSIFDIYFVSPIVSGMQAFEVEHEAPAKRLVLYVADGLRADKAFQSFPDPSPHVVNYTAALEPRPLAPFIREKVFNDGTFGISHTRVPTESRPGHVALIAGLYEDVSAVTTGWKLNPVNFDSVFNRSQHTWSWGSPDILPMFKEGAVPGRVFADTYDPDAEDFTKDATELDIWVFDKVKAMFKEAETNKKLYDELHQEKIVFFLHLLGLDTAGHGKRPYSKEYLHNIQVVDQGVKEITQLMDKFYGDDQTSYVFTADHGMSDWGSHGDGHPDNTRTPLVVWGAGVNKPILNSTGPAKGHEDGVTHDWGLDNVQRNDVAQADIAALMAYLAGLSFPVNSVGELPLPYITANAKQKARAMLANAKGILEMYRVKEEKKRSTALRYKPFSGFGQEGKSPSLRVRAIDELIEEEQYDRAIMRSSEVIQLALQGLRYLQTYDWLFLRALVTAGYLGWIAFALTTVIDLHVLHGKVKAFRTNTSVAVFSSIFVVISSYLYAQDSPWTYYAYAVFPVMFWEEVVARRESLEQGRKILFAHVDPANFMFKVIGFVALLEVLVQSYFHRELYTICYFAALVWPLFYGGEFIQENYSLWLTWTFCCLSMSAFTLLPALKSESIQLILAGGVLMLAVGVAYLFMEKSILNQTKEKKDGLASENVNGLSRGILGVQVGLVALAMFVTHSSVTSLQAKLGLPLGTQIVGWVVLVLSLILPFLHGLQPNSHYLHRLMVIFLAFAPWFIVLTISYEGLFYFAYCLTLLCWVRLEHHIYTYTQDMKSDTAKPAIDEIKNPAKPALAAAADRLAALKHGDFRALTLADARIALFFLYLLQSAFFSTGNIASISSFSLDAVSRLIPVFDPFSQGALLLLKIMIPFAIISANLGILNRRLGVAPSALFMIVMAISDVMTLNFFYMVKDEGSWLDIGTTISHFCIASGLCVFVAGLEFVSEVLVRGVEFDDAEERAKTRHFRAWRRKREAEEREEKRSRGGSPERDLQRDGVIWGGMKEKRR